MLGVRYTSNESDIWTRYLFPTNFICKMGTLDRNNINFGLLAFHYSVADLSDYKDANQASSVTAFNNVYIGLKYHSVLGGRT